MMKRSSQDLQVIHVRRLHKKTTMEDLRAFASFFGCVKRVNLWYGFGQAIIEMAHEEDAAALLAAFRHTPSLVRGKVVELSLGSAARPDQTYKQSHSNPDHVRKEVARCVTDLCRIVELKGARRAANELRAKHNALIRAYTHELEESGRQRNDVCWDWVTTGCCGKKGGDVCSFKHELVPFCDLPARYRWWTRKDTFPALREVGPYKKAINCVLKRLIDSVSNARGVLLDGAAANSAKAFCGGRHNRTAQDIFCPNVCTETFVAIGNSQACVPYHGSVRSFLDSQPCATFGFIYLDYCCCLNAGRRRVEKSPIRDIETIFRRRQCDPSGCILCISLAEPSARRPRWANGPHANREMPAGTSPDVDVECDARWEQDPSSEGTEEEEQGDGAGIEAEHCNVAGDVSCVVDELARDSQMLRALVSRLAATNGVTVVNYPHAFRWPGNFAEIFFVASAQNANAYLAVPDCPFVF